ncbi:MAG TPA: sensor domain-containing diguanylate cyclase [Desulfobulbaceae bacterium]|nr:MAG: hypothetical protein A2520_10835 [Deltaproteobacteria bacterium RIFOXYD12_FULL_53_23]HCC53949.1 sensor domain-containing diguanylate cyclase [Desulfobulbaceae bacterium]
MEDFFSKQEVDKNHDFFNNDSMESELLKERLFELYLLYLLSKKLNISVQLDDFFDKSMDFLKNSLKIEDFCLMLRDDDTGELKMWQADHANSEILQDVSFKLGEGISGLVAQTGEPILVQDVNKDPRFLHYKGKRTDIGSFISLPLRLNDVAIIGVLNIHKKETNTIQKNDVTLFMAVANNIALALERMKAYETLMNQSIHDDLTSLYTKNYFIKTCHREYSRAKRYGEKFAILMLDIDHFKKFNDTYGHPHGDEGLKSVAATLQENIRLGDIAARYGGEEFIVLLPNTDKEGATVVAEKIRNGIEEKELSISEGIGTRVTITAGVACYPEDGTKLKDIIATADRFLYLGKNLGRNRVVNKAE